MEKESADYGPQGRDRKEREKDPAIVTDMQKGTVNEEFIDAEPNRKDATDLPKDEKTPVSSGSVNRDETKEYIVPKRESNNSEKLSDISEN